MNAYQELCPKFDSYRERIKTEKTKQGYSIAALADASGISLSSVSRLLDGTQSDPKLYNAVAMCKVLNVSIDEIFGLRQSADSPAALKEQLQAASDENTRLREENRRLELTNGILEKELSARKPLIYVLLGLCAVLSLALAAYLIIDANIRDAGLIRFGSFSPGAWFFVFIILSAVAAGVFATVRVSKRHGKK